MVPSLAHPVYADSTMAARSGTNN